VSDGPAQTTVIARRLAAPAARAHRRVRLEARAARAVRSGRPIAVVIGNCQAPPVHRLLAASPAFAAAFALVAVPPIHEITPGEVRTLRRLLARTELLLSQPVAPGYRGLGLGTDELVVLAPPGVRTIRWPSLFSEGLFPYTVYVHTAPRVHVPAPIVEYHDVRFLACAAAGLRGAEARALLDEHRLPPEALPTLHRQMHELYGGVDDYCDVKVQELIRTREAAAFWTINHPARFVLEEIAAQIHALLGLRYVPVAGPEPLAEVIAPIEAAVLGDRPGTPRPDWVVQGRTVPRDELLDAHLAWYATRPDVVAAGAAEHEARRALLGLP